MKKIILMAFAILFFSACQTSPERFTTNSPEIESAKTMIKAYENGDWETWMAQYAEDAQIYHNSEDIALTGADVIENHKTVLNNVSSYGFIEESSNFEMVIDAYDDKWVYFWGVWEGTLEANEQVLKIPVHLAMKYVDGKNKEEYGFWDTAPLVEALTELIKEEAKEAELVE